MLSVTFTLLYLLVRRKSNPIVAIAVTMLAAAASSIHWLARPHLFTLLFLVLFYAALEQVQGRPDAAGGRAEPGDSAGGDGSLDQSARRVLRRGR